MDLPQGDYAWSVEQIDAYLVLHEGCILLRDGKPYVHFPSVKFCPDRERLIAQIVPHLKARRAEMLAYLADRYQTAFTPAESAGENVQVEQFSPLQHRKRIIEELKARGQSANRAVYYLKRNGLAALDSEKAVVKYYKFPRRRKVVVPVDREATHVCVEGDKEWTRLPKVTTAEEDTALSKGAGQTADKRAYRDRVIEPSFGLVMED